MLSKGILACAIVVAASASAVLAITDEDNKKPVAAPSAAQLKVGSAVGERLPTFQNKLTTIVDGKPVAADFDSSKTERPIAYVFVSQACPVTPKYGTRIKALAEKYAGKVDVVAVYPMKSESPESKLGYQKKHGWVAMIDDRDAAIAKALAISKTPEAVFCSKAGEVLFRGGLDDNPESDKVKTPHLANAIDLHLKGEKVTVTTAPAFG